MPDVCGYIDRLVSYGLKCRLIEAEDAVYVRNCLLDVLCLTSYTAPKQENTEAPLEEILEALSLFAAESGVIGNLPSSRERFETALMGKLTPRPSEVVRRFYEEYAKNPESATGFFYELSQDSNYISRYRTVRDLKWLTQTAYGELEITVNLSKPEKDPRDIAKARSMPQEEYPVCLLCIENEGYSGNPAHPARHNLRIIPVEIAGEAWGLQYSPYVYYNEHCIILNKLHTPMVIDKPVFRKLLSFVEQFPHYFAGSNADIPIVGGSILAHEHFQGGRHSFPMEKAPVERGFQIPGFESVDAGIVKWPLSVIRIAHENADTLTDCAALILEKWRGYTDETAFIFAATDGTPHNSITPIARKRVGKFELDLVLRNNITTPERPFGVYHPREELHNIKKENIGIIEVMGLAVLPSRLEKEMRLLKEALLTGCELNARPETSRHAEWFRRWRGNYGFITEENIDGILRDEIGNTFASVLEDAGVFKRNAEGQAAFSRFIGALCLD